MAPNAPAVLVRHLFALLGEAGVGAKEDRPRRLAVCEYVTWRPISSTDDLSRDDIRAVITTLEYWKSCGQLQYRCRRIADKIQEAAAS
ncbi:hypothetical protein [Mycolicibacterium iranicum]|uniref:hypothetical protein n=1 Tax=Mycolicibacterium iranicum TaxID=912594 RepID=UPI001F2CF7D3|nr:hypothetical protein [Mycolicibacterium iranicum]